jgi:VanZ family protein
MVAALFIGGAQPTAVGLVPAPWDKLVHGLFFCVLVILLRLCLTLPLWWLAALAVVVGAADELHQLFLPGRSAGFDDWLADLAGAGLAVVMIRLVGRYR